MTFQEWKKFGLATVGISDGTQPNEVAPTLTRGIHLRWGGAPDRGFPAGGYYVFRRDSSPTKSISLIGDDWTVVDQGVEFDDRDAGNGGTTTGRGKAWFDFRSESFLIRVDVVLSAGQTAGITLEAFTDGHRVDEATVPAGSVAAGTTLTIRGDRIDRIEIEGELWAVFDVRLHSGTQLLPGLWEPLTPAAPLTLPLRHPDYLANPGAEDLTGSRAVARDRIQYGDPGRLTTPASDVAGKGTVTVRSGSPIVRGIGTDWTADVAGTLFTVDGDDTAYAVLAVLGDDRLALGRPYGGRDVTDVGYRLATDRFGAIHDALAGLVEGGVSRGGMATRAVPRPVYATGRVTRSPGSHVVTGHPDSGGTRPGWTEEHSGLSLRVARADAGAVDVTYGETTVTGIGTDWGESLADHQFRVDGQVTVYTVREVSDPTTLELDRPYRGPMPQSSDGFGYGIYEHGSATVASIDGSATLSLAAPYAGGDDTDPRKYILEATLAAQGTTGGDVGRVSLPMQYPFESLLLASLDPAVAQLLGLYWIDETAVEGQAYDYFVVADQWGLVPLVESTLANESATGDVDTGTLVERLADYCRLDYLDGYTVFARELGDVTPLAVPTEPRAYVLPETTVRDTAVERRFAAGIRWNTERDEDRPRPTDPAVFYLWRRPLEDDPGDSPPAPSMYDPIAADGDGPVEDFLEDTRPTVRATPIGSNFGLGMDEDEDGTTVERPRVEGWPTHRLPLRDTRRPAGWYSYRVNGVDLFGRHTPLSEPAAWYDSEPEEPHDHPTEPAATDFAVELQSQLPPPPPSGVTAELLDPADPYVRKDAAYRAWRDTVGPDRVGLRVGWHWTRQADAQAPDTVGFRVHAHPGRLNVSAGRTTDVVTDPTTNTTTVTTTLSHTADPTDATTAVLPASSFAGCDLRIDGASFEVRDSRGTNVLEVDVTASSVPSVGAAVSVSVPAVFTRGQATVTDGSATVYGDKTGWTPALVGQSFRFTASPTPYVVAAVPDTGALELDRPYRLPATRTADADEPSEDTTPAMVDSAETLSGSYAVDHPASTNYTDGDRWQWTLDVVPRDAFESTPVGDGDYWRYEVFLDAPGVDDSGGGDDTLVPSRATPVVHANVGVSAFTDHLDGPVGGPAPVARVHRDQPPAPDIPDIPSEIDFATRPDYDGKSYYTVRWRPPDSGLRTHVLRSLDETLFRVDWDRRRTDPDPTADPPIPSPYALSADDERRYPPDLRGDGGAVVQRREQIERELTVAFRVDEQPDGAFVSRTAALERYRGLAPDALRVLAGLPGNEAAFTQLTTDPLDPADHPNVEGPDFEAGDPTGPEWSAFVDAFDGRSRNRYLYRVVAVDEANNRSAVPSYPTAPVQSRDGVMPTKPTIRRVVAGHPDPNLPQDRAITLEWTPVTTAGVDTYRVYRIQDPDAAMDIRLMRPVATVDPTEPTVTWTDVDRPAGSKQYYRVVTVDDSGRESPPSEAVTGRAVDTAAPAVPAITTCEWVQLDDDGTWISVDASSEAVDSLWTAVRVAWEVPADAPTCTVEHATSPDSFENTSEWLDTARGEHYHPNPQVTIDHEYRLRVMSRAGIQDVSDVPTQLAALVTEDE